MTRPGGGNVDPKLTPGSRLWLWSKLKAAGLSDDEIRGIVAMNVVEGGFTDPRSTLGFTQSQIGYGGPDAAVDAFLQEQWFPRTAGGIPGVKAGRVTDWNAYMTFIREKIVGQTGASPDWQGNPQPSAADYQQRLMSSLGRQRGGPIYGQDWKVAIRHPDGSTTPVPLRVLYQDGADTHWTTDVKLGPGDELIHLMR